MKMSFVIPAYNEENGIAACLDAIIGQKQNHDIEIIVVNNASTDGTAAAVEK
jgi:glycosyltransferase involved in cell wall biosynthesis